MAYEDATGPGDFVDLHLLRSPEEEDTATEARYSHRFDADAFMDFRFLQGGAEPRLVVLLRRSGRTVLELRDLELQVRARVTVPSNAAEPSLGTVLADPSGREGSSFFVLAGSSLLRYGADLELRDQFASPEATSMVVSLDRSGGTVVLIGNTIGIARVGTSE
jgi:hypothetical protein